MGQSGKLNSMKSTIVVLGAMAFGWLTLEFAFKPYLDKGRAAIKKSDPSNDADESKDYSNGAPKGEEYDMKNDVMK
ncbi:hypothetical protein GIB67_004264 [Kingdonia uniflora]|uniref:Outer envelope membrane protein 7 n=1 Tax=Kingdonia uniflora TaxID=39325 RepID=A0A7J7MR24_9MAGN|nr:hypothetical protein GIB67_004264 [Kingdonia uniflora]